VAEKRGQSEGQEKQSRWGRGFTATTVYAAFGFLTALVSFVFLVNPAWRPDPRERQIADLTISAIDPGIAWGAYAKRVSQAPGEAETACLPGTVVYLKVSLQGFKHRETKLKFLTMNAVTHTRVGQQEGSRLRGVTTADQGVIPQWAQWPYRASGSGTYFVRFELFSGGELLAIADAPTFRVVATDYNTRYYQCIADMAQGKSFEGVGFAEATPDGTGGFDVGRWLLYAALAVVVGLLAALGFHLATSVLRRRSQSQSDAP
jgi:hypothetical protein